MTKKVITEALRPVELYQSTGWRCARSSTMRWPE